MPGIKAPILSWEFIREKADDFRKEFSGQPDLLPVPVIEIVELKLRLIPIPIPGLMEFHNIDGFLTKDLKNICIDSNIYENPWKENRLRFTYAHECGHLVLHKRELQLCKFRTTKGWENFRSDFDEEDLNWFELQAHEFAGRLLVPRSALINEIEVLSSKIAQYKKLMGGDEDPIIGAISRLICKKFGISAEVIVRRIKSEKIEI